MGKKKRRFPRRGAILCALLLCGLLPACGTPPQAEAHTATTFAMDTLVEQQAFGAAGPDAMRQVNTALARWENQMSRFKEDSDIGRVNAAAGGDRVAVAAETALFIRQALALTPQSEGSFAISIAPLTKAWGITTDTPRVPGDAEIAALLPLVDDSAVTVAGNYITLEKPGMGLDLGGIAKGAACDLARQVYQEYGISGALLSIGGNIYAHGTKPDGTRFRIAFNDPVREGSTYIASFEMEDAVIAMSGGYERYFEQDGRRYIHIINPATGRPAESDILSVGAICQSGAEADFWSTTLYIWGKERVLAHMRAGGVAVMLDNEKNLYISESLRGSFALHVNEGEYNVAFVPGG